MADTEIPGTRFRRGCSRVRGGTVVLLGCLATAWPLAAAGRVPVPATAQDGEADFDAGWRLVRLAVEQSRFAEARKQLLKLIDRHPRQSYVRSRLPEITQVLSECAFRMSVTPPHPRQLVSGELLDWNRKSGRVSLRYREGELADFEPLGSVLVHPLLFQGAYEVELSTAAHPGAGHLSLALGMHGDSGYWVDVGDDRSPSFLTAVSGDEQQVLAAEPVPEAVPGKRLVVQATLESGRLEVRFNGRTRLETSITGPPGRFGLRPPSTSFDVSVVGTTEGAWLDGLVDTFLRNEWLEFRARYRPEEELPAWLLAPVEEAPPEDFRAAATEVTMSLRQAQVYQRAAEFLRRGDTARALELLAADAARDLPEWASAFLRAQAQLTLGQPLEALRLSEAACRARPDLEPAQLLRRELLREVGRRGDAIAAYREYLERHPRDAEAVEDLVNLLIRDGRPEEAQEAIQTGLENGAALSGLEELHRTLARAVQGPAFHRRSAYDSDHYGVVSDMDRGTCMEVAHVLEDALRSFSSNLRTPGAGSRRFRVYVFRGQAGYLEYAQDVLGPPMHQTAGLYSPQLHQLLLWNVPDRRELLRSARHEAFHQYLDGITEFAPMWLNEGLASYFEEEAEDERSRARSPRARSFLALLRDAWVPLSELVALDQEAFYRNPGLHYAESWALVHLLQHGDRAQRRILHDVLGALTAPQASPALLESVMESLDLVRLESELRGHVLGLSSE